ncbi:MAG: DUF3520 domain-containing protein, partial [Deltaproteobacteria bacterium]|nr:DUF3520 domain-containing protein [Deltaproteobacteria bacterium]
WFGMKLRGSRYAGEVARPWPAILRLAKGAEGGDRHGYRREFQQLVLQAAKVVRGR